ncbi:MAG: hypothetical protein QM692_13005 [Thermomicrobiales bacterium]
MDARDDELTLHNIALLLGEIGLLFLALSYYSQTTDPWFSSLAQNLGTSLLFVVLAVSVISRFEEEYRRRREDQQWAAVKEHTGLYIGNVARLTALSYRNAVGIPDENLFAHISMDDSKIDQHYKMADWIESELIPHLTLLWLLNREEWADLLNALEYARYEAREVLLLYPDLMPPDIRLHVIEIRRGIEKSHQSLELFGSLLGAPDEAPYIQQDMRAFRMYERTRQHGMSHVAALWWCRMYSGNDASEEATKVLQSSARLLRILASDYLPDEPSAAIAITNGTETGRAEALPAGDR